MCRRRSIRGRKPERVARAGIALVPECRRIYPQLTVDEKVRSVIKRHIETRE